MSKKPAAIPLFADAYLADTTHLTTEEHGAYLLLLMACWRQVDCALPNDDRKLARITGLSPRKWASIKATIFEFWTIENGRIFQPRLRREHDFVCKKSEANRQAAEARWGKQGPENKQDGGMRSQCEGNAPPPPPIIEPNGSIPPIPPKPKTARVAKIAMTPDWWPAPLPPDVAELVARWPPGRFDREVAEFREYWIETGARRPGWDRTFRTRIRDIHDRILRDSRNDRQRSPSPAGGIAAALDRRIGIGDPAGSPGRHDVGGGGDYRALPPPAVAVLR